MLTETTFHTLADSFLTRFMDKVEEADKNAALDVEMEQGGLVITLENGKQYVVSKHAPSRQLWLSSPLSGGLHFSYDDAAERWRLTDGRDLETLLAGELQQLAHLTIAA